MADHVADHSTDRAPGEPSRAPGQAGEVTSASPRRRVRRARPQTGRRRLLRSAIVVLAMVPVLAAGLYWVATRSWFIIAAVTPALEERLGGDVGIASARYDGGGTFVFDDLIVRVPGMQGLGAEVARIGELAVDVDMDRLLRGEVQILHARVGKLHIRASESATQPGSFNFMNLIHDWDRDSRASTRLPHVEITSAIVEMGVHDGAEYTQIGQRRLAGQMHRIAPDESVFSFELGEIDEFGNGLGEDGLVINGQWDSETFEYGGRIDGLRLDERARRLCPQTARFYWDRMQLEGKVGSASIEWRQGEPLFAELTVQDVAVTMPVHVEGLWSIYRAGEVLDTDARPRIQGSCTIRLVGDRLEIDKLQGHLTGSEADHATVGVPYRLSLVVPELPTLNWSERTQWLDQMLATLPFEMELTMDDFRFDPEAEDEDAWLELPTVVARMFALFEMTGWQLSTKINVSRGPASVNADGTLTAGEFTSVGRAFIRHASGQYRKFPYKLRDVEAYIEFDNNKCDVHYLNGKGAGDSLVRIAGTIAPPTRHGQVNLRVDATNVPLDEKLREALSGQGAEVFDALFHKPSYERLASAGLVTTAEDVDTMREQAATKTIERGTLMQQLEASRAAARNSSDDGPAMERVTAMEQALAETTAEVERLNALIEAGPFELGGVVDLNLNVRRERGEGHRALVTGEIDIKSAGIVYEKFPYPIVVTDGGVSWREEGVRIKSNGETRGLTLITAGGGRGVLSGHVDLLRDEAGETQGHPQLNLTMAGDTINPALLAAIPSGDGDGADGAAPSHGRAMRLLRGLGLSGSIECLGDIVALPSGAMHYDFIVGINNGSCEPTPEVSSVMAELGLRWPEGFSLEDVEGVVRVTPGEIGFVDLVGRRGDGTVTANGRLDIAGSGEAELNVTFESLALEQYLVNLAPADGVERAQELWDQYRPQGTFDAELKYLAEAGGPGVAELVIRPRLLRISASGQPVALVRQGGSIVLHEDEVRFEQLELDVNTGSRDDGVLVLDGSYGMNVHGQMLSVTGAWRDGMFECPLILEMMRLIGAEQEAERYASLMPAGSFDAEFSYRSPQGEVAESYRFSMQPSSIAMVLDGMVLSATLEPTSRVVFTPGLIELTEVVGAHSGGAFRMDGAITLGEAPTIDLDLAYRGDLLSQHIWTMLPASVRGALEDIHFHSAQAGRVSDASLVMRRAKGDDDWSMDFAGLVETDSCSFDVGIPFSEVAGAFRIVASRPADGPAQVSIQAEADRLRVLEREMTGLTANMVYDQATQSLTIRDLRGELYGGIVTAEASVGLGGERDPYSMRIVAAGVALEKISAAESLAASESEVERLSRRRTQKDGEEQDAERGSRGQLFASLDLAGERGRGYSRTGRGVVRVVGGDVANLSLTLRVLQLMQFVPPFADTMDFADVEYYVAGDRVVFERILLEIPFLDRAALQLHGEGEMDFNTFELSTRFHSRGTIPMLSDIVGGLTDRLYQIEVTGPITDPVARVRALPDFTSSRQAGGNSVTQPVDPELVVQEPMN